MISIIMQMKLIQMFRLIQNLVISTWWIRGKETDCFSWGGNKTCSERSGLLQELPGCGATQKQEKDKPTGSWHWRYGSKFPGNEK